MIYYYKVTPKVHYIFFIMGLVGLGMLFTFFKFTNKIWMGFIITGIVLYLSFEWEYILLED